MLVLFSALFALASVAIAFPSYGSLAGLSREELDQIIPTLNYQAPPNPPGPLKDDSTKLVNDAAHPWKPLDKDDIRGPCPGLNTLASHGVRLRLGIWTSWSNFLLTICFQYLPRSGIATPAQIVNTVQEGTFNFVLFSVAL